MRLSDYGIICVVGNNFSNYYYRGNFIGMKTKDGYMMYLYNKIYIQHSDDCALRMLWKSIMNNINYAPIDRELSLINYLSKNRPIMYK